MMNKQAKYEKSPFATKKYGGTKHGNTITYNPQKEFKDILTQFIKDKFDDDITISGALDLIIKDYFFRYAYKNKGYYNKTVIALTYEHSIVNGLENDYGELVDFERFKDFHLDIRNIGVLDRYAKTKYSDAFLDEDLIDNYELVGALVCDNKFKNVDNTIQEWIKLNWIDPVTYDENDIIVLEIPLNNNLDAVFNGFYCYENLDGTPNENMHVGINIAQIDSVDFQVDAFPIIYYWYLDENYNVKIQDIFKINKDDLANLLYRYSDDSSIMFNVLNSLIEIGTGYEIRLKEEIIHNNELQKKLDDSNKRIERLRKAVDIDKKVNG